jgi:hypothetical protein
MSIARWIGALALVIGAGCKQPVTNDTGSDGTATPTVTTSTVAPCTTTDSVSGTAVPCYSSGDSVSGTSGRISAVSVVVRAGNKTMPWSAITPTCRTVSTGAAVSCSLGVVLGATTQSANVTAPAESVSGTTGRDSTK